MRLLTVLAVLASLASPQAVLAQSAVVTPQRKFPQTVPAGNYSGITWLGGNRYAVANDKSPTAGFHLMDIDIDSISGRVLSVRERGFVGSGQPNRDEEGICYVPATRTVYVSGEADSQVLEYTLEGRLTGRRLRVPPVFLQHYPNASLEALTYNAVTHRFWTTSEQTLRPDTQQTQNSQYPCRLRLQSFTDDGEPAAQYWYETDLPAAIGRKGHQSLGVSALAALDDGRLVVLERDYYVARRKLGSFVYVKLYVVNPSASSEGALLEKQLLTEFRTKINLTRRNFANYEGLCVGPRLADGRLVLVLVADSQNQYKGWLRDWFRTVVVSGM